RSKARQLVAGLSNDVSKVVALGEFVQSNCTYKAIEFGRRGRIPNRPAEILENKYGDCKDHAVLLQQMLGAVGISADLALVGHGEVLRDLPSMDQFDHMIVYVPGQGAGTFVDCTDKGADLAAPIPVGLAGFETLILDTNTPRIAGIPPYVDTGSAITVRQHLHLTDLSDAVVEETMELTGPHAAFLRDFLLNYSPTDRQMAMQRELGMDDIEVSDFNIDALEKPGEPLRVSFTFAVKKEFHRAGNRLNGNLRAGFERSYVTAAAVEKRSTPFELRFPLVLRSSVSVDIPDRFQAEEGADPSPNLDERFGTCHTQRRLEGGKLDLECEYRRRAGRFGPGDYSAYRESMAQALLAIEREVGFKLSDASVK
ncbi:MAG TPA: transglutaminase-like domain-containing protein, partial [Verrucomicrobiae bacterium]|nr:transglutaminase-like domain-containing protein [Verrucomicrobiae bacterium]